jgi:DHA1 family tetracycline resistance protein-like MFS transporter
MTEPAEPIQETPWRTVFLPSILLLLAMLNLTLVVVGLKELILDELGGTARDASLFFSVEMMAYIVFAPLWGMVSDRLGRRRLLIVVGFLASSVFYASYTVVESLSLLLTLRFFQGACSVMGWSTLMAMVLDQPDVRRRGRLMGVMGAAISLGVALGAPLGGILTKAHGPRAPFVASAGCFLLLAVASLLLLRDPSRLRRHVAMGEIFTTLRDAPRLLLPSLFYFVDRYTVGCFVILFPLYVADAEKGLGIDDPALRGQYLALFLLPFALLQYFTGRLTEHTGPYLPLLGGSLIYGLVLCAVGYSGGQTLWWVMVILGILAATMFPPAIFLMAQLSDSRTRGSAMGGFNLAGSLGFAVGPLVGVWVLERTSYGATFLVAGGLEIFAALVGWIVVRSWANKDSKMESK